MDASSTSTRDERVGDLVEGDRPARRPGRRARAACSAVRLATTISLDARAREREGHALAHAPGAEHEHAPVVERAEPAGGQRHRGRRHRHRVPADRGLGAGPLAHLDRVAEGARQAAGRCADSRSAAFHASRTWPRISPSPMIIESRPGGHPEEVRHRGVVVVRVHAGRRTRRGRRPRCRRGSRGTSCMAGWKSVALA